MNSPPGQAHLTLQCQLGCCLREYSFVSLVVGEHKARLGVTEGSPLEKIWQPHWDTLPWSNNLELRH